MNASASRVATCPDYDNMVEPTVFGRSGLKLGRHSQVVFLMPVWDLIAEDSRQQPGDGPPQATVTHGDLFPIIGLEHAANVDAQYVRGLKRCPVTTTRQQSAAYAFAREPAASEVTDR
jgi:hypothetical protein